MHDMIQDIGPMKLFNQYHEDKPSANDVVFVFQNNQILAHVAEESQVQYLKFEDVPAEVVKEYHFTYLLSVEDEKYFMMFPRDVKRQEEFGWVPEGFEFMHVNTFRRFRPKYMAFAAITAYHLYIWYRDNQFCGRCGGHLHPDHRERMMHCETCGNAVYPKISPAVIVGVTDGGRILMSKYARGDYHHYALLAGFTEIGETLEETVRREVMEEVGLKVKNIRYYKSQPWGLSGSLLAGFYCDLDGSDEITLEEEELKCAEWFKASEMEIEPDHVSLTREMMEKFKNDHTKR